MATIYDNAVQQLYVAYFNRPADTVGMDFWTKAIAAANGSTAAVATAFSQSAEYTNEYKGMTNAQIVDQVYQNLFGRGATDSGAKFWIDGLNNKTITIADVVTAVAAGAQGSDKVAFNNKVIAATQFTGALDTEAEQAGYSGDDANAIAKEFLAGVTSNVSLSAAILPENLNKIVAEAVAAGTEFTVASALKSLNDAMDARDDYLESITADDATSTETSGSVAATLLQAQGDVRTALSAAVNADAGKLSVYDAGTAAVKQAIVNAALTDSASALATAQSTLKTANTNVANIEGLASAISSLTAATAASAAAQKNVTAAAADLAAKEASYETLHGVTLNIAVDGSVTIENGATDIPLINLTSGKLVLASGITEADYQGVTALLTSSQAKEVADAALTRAVVVEQTYQADVNLKDKTTDAAADALAVSNLRTAMSLTSTDPIPTESQIAAYKASLATDAEKTTFQGVVDAYHASNPLLTAQQAAAASVKEITGEIADLNEAVAALTVAQQHSDDLAGYDATISAATTLFADNDYNLVSDWTVTDKAATADSDVYVAGKVSGSIALFGLQGNDSIFVGSDYTLSTGKLSAGDDAKLEVFVAQNGADTTLKIEQHTFSSHVSGAPVSEIVTITLVGVNATDVHLDANGLITLDTAGA